LTAKSRSCLHERLFLCAKDNAACKVRL
jgi:hypothetical protein